MSCGKLVVLTGSETASPVVDVAMVEEDQCRCRACDNNKAAGAASMTVSRLLRRPKDPARRPDYYMLTQTGKADRQGWTPKQSPTWLNLGEAAGWRLLRGARQRRIASATAALSCHILPNHRTKYLTCKSSNTLLHYLARSHFLHFLVFANSQL